MAVISFAFNNNGSFHLSDWEGATFARLNGWGAVRECAAHVSAALSYTVMSKLQVWAHGNELAIQCVQADGGVDIPANARFSGCIVYAVGRS
ncbi:hypothetical protein [Bifidobacterium tissieri]|uniref:hypothetical protein n=1 Tax=Bifidobacterium tissieri TaxID=1630162 RepID=UPI00123B65FF|nr:hypothetical protein [Bifidobacterium tissieri]KAA8829353.1 hypothetical protein EM849_11145 [Bifidobacterium tissieri]